MEENNQNSKQDISIAEIKKDIEYLVITTKKCERRTEEMLKVFNEQTTTKKEFEKRIGLLERIVFGTKDKLAWIGGIVILILGSIGFMVINTLKNKFGI